VTGAAVALQPLQIAADLRGVLVAQVAVFFERLVNDFFHPRRHVGIEAQRRGRRAIENRIEDNGRSIAPKRHRARRHLIQHGTKGKQVGAHIELFALGLLRRHVGHRPHRHPWTGEILDTDACGRFNGRCIGLAVAGVSLARPKSRILACPRLVTKMLAGLMSR